MHILVKFRNLIISVVRVGSVLRISIMRRDKMWKKIQDKQTKQVDLNIVLP